ncbi:hypothetical protein OG417_41160 [Actinoallomurus sp. NBC_01490]|uniref:hypothetical protein n=1 Tax=Actinoallomurus sp. NBC_01490 TaxID=2903557 RepID=UPI002E35B73C|nr:hypothetical protein [Actinoallomurus sp. NBC_01490]
MTAEPEARSSARIIGARWSTARRVAGYSAALTMSLYLLVKVVWVIAALAGYGPADVGTAGWITLNAVTVGMSAVGVMLGLALAQHWGRRLPALPVIFFSWMAAGFLVPMLPYTVTTGILGAAGVGRHGGESGHSTSAPGWEMVFISIGFAGMALGLAVALPIYLRERWPSRFLGRIGGHRSRAPWPARPGMIVAAALGLLWLYWAFGGTIGLDPALRDRWDLNGRLLIGNTGLWALIGGWSLSALVRRRPARLPLWIPMTLVFTASGSLFAWGCWKLPLDVIRPSGYAAAELPVVGVIEHALSIGTGLALLIAALGLRFQRVEGAQSSP